MKRIDDLHTHREKGLLNKLFKYISLSRNFVIEAGNKISEFFAEKSEKSRLSDSLEKKKQWKTRLEEKSARNRFYRRFFGEKSELADFSTEKSVVCCTRWKARRRSEIAAIFRREIDFIADISAIYRLIYRKIAEKSWPLRLLVTFDPTVQICAAFFLKSNGYIFDPTADFKSKA